MLLPSERGRAHPGMRSQTLIGEQPLNFGGIGIPWSAAGDDGIEEDEKLSGAGDEGLLVGFPLAISRR